jgi:CBS domain-containing protein
MSVGRICVRSVDLAERVEPVQAAAQRMNARNVGTLVVLGSDRHPIGVVTDRDLAVRVLGNGRDPSLTTVGDVMTPFPRSIREDIPIEVALQMMRVEKCRRLPVIDSDGKLVGLVSVDDILELLIEEFREIGMLLRQESPQSLAMS